MICSDMSDATSPLPDALDDWSRPLVERQLQVLGRLAEAGLEVAVAVERQARAADDGAALQGLAMAYARAARAVRMSILLQSRLIEDLKAREAEAEDPEFERSEGHKLRVERIVGRVARAAFGDDEETVERLAGEAAERLDDEDLYGEVVSRPVGELVALICRDLGLDPDWNRLAEEAWARAEMEGGDPRSPFARPPPPMQAESRSLEADGSIVSRRQGGVPPPLPPNLRN